MAIGNFLAGLVRGYGQSASEKKDRERQKKRDKLEEQMFQLKFEDFQRERAEKQRRQKEQESLLSQLGNNFPAPGEFEGPQQPRSITDLMSDPRAQPQIVSSGILPQFAAMMKAQNEAKPAGQKIAEMMAALQAARSGSPGAAAPAGEFAQGAAPPANAQQPRGRAPVRGGGLGAPTDRVSMSVTADGGFRLTTSTGKFLTVNDGVSIKLIDEATGQTRGIVNKYNPGIPTKITNPDGSESMVQLPPAMFSASGGQAGGRGGPMFGQGVRTKPAESAMRMPAQELKNFVQFDAKAGEFITPRGRVTRGEVENQTGDVPKFIPVTTEQRQGLGSIKALLNQFDSLRRVAAPVFSGTRSGVLNRAIKAGVDSWKKIAQTDPALVTYRGRSKAILSQISRTLGGEKGTLNEGDIQRTRGLVPHLFSLKGLPDTEEVATFKLDLLEAQIKAQYNSILGVEFFDTSGLEENIDRVLEQDRSTALGSVITRVGELEQGVGNAAKQQAADIIKRFELSPLPGARHGF